MTKIVRSGGSLNYTCGKAETWFKSLSRTVPSLGEELITIRDGYAIAEELCNIMNYPLDRVVGQARGRLTGEKPLLTLHPSVPRKIDDICRHIVPDTSRWTTTSRSRWGLRLLRVIATVSLTRDLNVLRVVARELDIADNQQTTHEEKVSKEVSSSDTMVATGREAPLSVEPDIDELFRTALQDGDKNPSSGEFKFFPDNYGMDLQKLRRLADVLLGPVKRRADVDHVFEAATPRLVVIGQSSLSICALTTSEGRASVPEFEDTPQQELDGGDALGAVENVFSTPQWNVTFLESSIDISKRVKAAVIAVKRKKITVTEADHIPVYTYGVLRDCEMAFSAGLSIIITGIGGTGKSTVLSRLPTLGATVFEIGTEVETSGTTRYRYRFDEMELLLKKAKRTKGRKVLICHEFFISQDLLPRLSIFDQFAFAGDPRQPGAGDARHLFEFVRSIGGRQFTLRVVWRVGHPLSTMATNFFAYGSQFKLCERVLSNDDRQFDVIECEDSIRTIAERMVVYAVEKHKTGRSVIIAASGRQLVAAVRRIVRSISDFPSKIECRYLSDLQGREADMLVFDLHDVASAYRKPDEALRFAVMLLGRARYTTCILLGERNSASDRQAALPIEVFFGVLLRYRVRSIEKRAVCGSGPHFEKFSVNFYLSMLDEQTIKVCSRKPLLINITIIKDCNSHNAAMMIGHSCIIEAPSFFVHDANLEHEIALIHRLLQSSHTPNLHVNTLAQIERYLQRR